KTGHAEIDPVCGMKVDPAHAPASASHQGKTYYFCCSHCREKFIADPQRYLNKSLAPVSAVAPPSDGRVEYTCPMHPEIVSDRPGACALCGMALEPRTVTADAGPSHEEIDMMRRFWLGVLLGLPVFILAMLDMLPHNPLHHYATALNWLQLALATP